MFFFLAFLLIFPAWMRGGTRIELMGPVPWIALAAMLAMLFKPGTRNAETLTTARMRVWRNLLADPILFVGVAFIFMLWLQWWNGPRAEVFDVSSWSWIFAPPPKPTLALFCVNRDDALEMLLWFIPLYAILLVIRNGFSRTQKKDLLQLLLANAAMLALLGFAQYYSRSTGIYWMTQLKGHFFAAFGYQNHAAAFFVLSAFLGVGILLRGALRKKLEDDFPWLVPAILLCMGGALFSKSRAGIILIGFLVGWGLIYGVFRLRRPQQGAPIRLGLLVSLVSFVGVMVYVASVVPGNPVKTEMTGTTVEGVVSRVAVEGDPLKQAALQMWQDHPWFGTGGWGFRRFLPHYYKPADGSVYGAGQANVHMDPLQFLVEFGAIGAGMLLLTVLLLLAPVAKALRQVKKEKAHDSRHWLMRVPPLGMAILVGLALILAHSLVDLPFRSPAILWMWFALLACAPEFCDRSNGRAGHGEEG
jgi:O-antigen ligase